MFSSNYQNSFESVVAITLCFQLCSAQSTELQTKTVEEVPLQQSIHLENTTIRVPPTIDYCLKSTAAITLRFQLCSARYTVLESSLQSDCLPRKIRMIPIYKRTVGKPCIALPRINTLGCQQKEIGHKGGQR